jgi:hypothetical protein
MASLAYCHGKCGKHWEREPGEGLYCSAECERRAVQEQADNEVALLGLGFLRDPVGVNAFIRGNSSLTVEEVYRDGLAVALAKVGIKGTAGE